MRTPLIQSSEFDPYSRMRLLLAFCLILIAFRGIVRAQGNQDLVPIEFSIKGGGTTEINSIQRGGRVYLPLHQVFDYLRIKNTYDPATGSITGFLVSPDTSYEIQTREGSARVGDRSERTSLDDFIAYQNDFFFVPEFYQRLFLLPIEYRPRRVAAVMGLRRDLPYFLDTRLRRLEQKLVQKEEEFDPEFVFPREYPLLDGFRLDWSFSQLLSAEVLPRRTFAGRVGFFVLGGDLTSRYNARLSPKFNLIDSRHLWRYVPPTEKVFKQLLVGDFVSNGLLSREEYGVRITNIPPYNRLVFAQEDIVGNAFPHRKTYLFSGSVLTDVADSTFDGSYRFGAPLRYGANLMDVRSFDIWGEPYRDSYRFLVPNTLVPPGVVDFDMSIGRLRERSDPWHGSFSLFVGASSHITVGSRVEYFDMKSLNRRVVPSLVTVARLTPHVAGEVLFVPNTFGRASMTAEFPWLLNLDASYTIFKAVPVFNPRNSLYEWNLSGSYPILFNGSRIGLTSSFQQNASPRTRERLWTSRIESGIGFFYPSIVHFVGWSHSFETNLTRTTTRQSDFGARFRLPRNIFVRLGAVYDHLDKDFTLFRFDAAVSPIDKLTLDFQYDRRLDFKTTIWRLQIRYYFPFATFVSTTTGSRGNLLHSQRVSGFVGYVPEVSEFIYDYRARTSFGGFFVRPFLDRNNNGIKEIGEEDLRTSAPKTVLGTDGFSASLRRKEGLGWGDPNVPPYRKYTMRLGQKSLDDPLWKPRFETFSLTAEPGRYHVFDIPVIVGGSVRGKVLYRIDETDVEGESVSGVIVRLSEIPGGTTLREPFGSVVQTFSTGEFEFFGVPPGDYEISLDTGQLTRSSYRALELRKRITIQVSEQGDQVEGVNFEVTTLE